MAERRVLRMGDPRLRRIAAPVEAFDTEELRSLITDMWDTMAAEGGVGLAAPQIGAPVRLVVFGMELHARDPELPPVPYTVLINPVITPLDEEMEPGWEGCLSVPGMRGLVPRYRRIRYVGFDPSGERIDREAEGYHARVVQHECDHLDGILYPERMDDLTRFGFEEEIVRAEWGLVEVLAEGTVDDAL